MDQQRIARPARHAWRSGMNRSVAKARQRSSAGSALGWPERLFDQVWRLFASVRFALVLILFLAAATLAGTTLMQAPGGITFGTADYASWVQQLRPRYGAWTDVFSSLQLLSVFGSWWYRAAMAALVVSITVCSVNRWPAVARGIFSPRVRVPDRFFERAPLAASLQSEAGLDEAAQVIRASLGARGYRVLEEQETEARYLYADKHRFAPLGTFVSHFSLILVLAGAGLSGVLGFSEEGLVIPEGATREVGFNTGLSVKAVSFVDEWYPEGPPKDYRSELILYKNGVEVKQQTIHVNEPMEYDGIRFHQSFYGPAAYFEVTDSAGNLLFADGVALAWKTRDDRPAGTFSLPQRNLTVYVVGPTSGKRDLSIKSGEMRLEVYQGASNAPLALANVQPGQSREIGGLQFTLVRERQFTGLQVAKDPGALVIWIASVLLVLGQVAVWYFPHRRVWAVVRGLPVGGSHLALGAVVRRDTGFSREFERLVKGVDSSVHTTTGAQEASHV